MLDVYTRMIVDRVARASRYISGLALDFSNVLDARSKLQGNNKQLLLKNSVYKKKYDNEPGIVIMTGPSLSNNNLEGLGKFPTFSASGFFKHSVIEEWSPTFYFFMDVAYFESSAANEEYYKNFNNKVSKETKIVAPIFRGKNYFSQTQNHNGRELVYFTTAGRRPVSRKCDFTKVMPLLVGTSALALAWAVYSGCNPIYLLGFDHNYMSNRGQDVHFYKDATIPGHKLADKPISNHHPFDHEMIMNFRLWQNYRWIKKCAEKNGQSIINCTDGSYLDLFERSSWDSIRETLIKNV